MKLFFQISADSVQIWKKSEPKVFNWSEFHFSEVTSYKIHILGAYCPNLNTVMLGLIGKGSIIQTQSIDWMNTNCQYVMINCGKSVSSYMIVMKGCWKLNPIKNGRRSPDRLVDAASPHVFLGLISMYLGSSFANICSVWRDFMRLGLNRFIKIVLLYTPLQNVWHGSKSVVMFGLIKILTHPC